MPLSPSLRKGTQFLAQMGVHLVFFLHITTGAESLNNVLALAFGLLIVFLLLVGSLWIMTNLNHNMVTMEQLIQMRRLGNHLCRNCIVPRLIVVKPHCGSCSTGHRGPARNRALHDRRLLGLPRQVRAA